jgi:hypothetical protein
LSEFVDTYDVMDGCKANALADGIKATMASSWAAVIIIIIEALLKVYEGLLFRSKAFQWSTTTSTSTSIGVGRHKHAQENLSASS